MNQKRNLNPECLADADTAEQEDTEADAVLLREELSPEPEARANLCLCREENVDEDTPENKYHIFYL
jgi:hypothetical protein